MPAAPRRGTVPSEERRSAIISLRAPPQTRELIARAAEASGRTLTDFLLESATERAREILLDRRLFALDAERHEAFLRALDAAPPANPALKTLMRKRPLWDA